MWVQVQMRPPYKIHPPIGRDSAAEVPNTPRKTGVRLTAFDGPVVGALRCISCRRSAPAKSVTVGSEENSRAEQRVAEAQLSGMGS